LLLAFIVAGCAQHAQQRILQPKASTSNAGYSATQLPARAIISFQHPTSDNLGLSAAISAACHCQPVFFRPYLGDALIYEITLPAGHSFAAFSEALMRDAETLQIRAVEQDSIMQHQ
jgi:hypothetical protein